MGAVGLAIALLAVDATVDLQVDRRWPLVFGAGAAGARGLLTAVAGSMITVAGVVFSITIVALALTSSQYTSRVLRNFMGDRINQIVLGVFVGIFAYCLVVLRTIRGGDEGAFVPPLSVLVGLILAFVGIAFLIFFIHHIATSIQASSIIAVAARETMAAADRLFPRELGEGDSEDTAGDPTIALAERTWTGVDALKTGYIESVDGDALLAWALERGIVVRMERGIGEFIVKGTLLVSISSSEPLDDQTKAELNAIYVVSRQRTLHQDVAFGIRQIVDIALKALSPGSNDTTTAVMCVDYLGAVLVQLAERPIVPLHRLDRGELRVIARGPSFNTLLAEAFDQIRQNAEGNVTILLRQVQALEAIGSRTRNIRRRQALLETANLIGAVAKRSVTFPHDRASVETALSRLSEAFKERSQ